MKKAKLFMMLALLVMGVSNLFAQDVTVHPGNGKMLPALKSGSNPDTFYGWNGFATWKHEQLSLTMTTGDSDINSGTNASGQLEFPANDIFESADKKCLQIGKGLDMSTYLTIALPDGYRFEGYSITFRRINQVNGMPDNELYYNSSSTISFGETDNTFGNYNKGNGTYKSSISYSNRGNYSPYTISRESQTVNDMGNVLYFKLSCDDGNRAFIQLDKITLKFTAEYNYTPLQLNYSANGVSAVDIPFNTSKMDYGQLKMRDINGRTPGQRWYDESTARISYDGTIYDMRANLTLYEQGSTETITAAQNDFDGTPGDRVKKFENASISSASSYLKLEASKHRQYQDSETGEVIYYLESPVWATSSQNNHKHPIGYRIVGANFECAPGTASTYFPATFKIEYESTGHGPDEDGLYGMNYYNSRYTWEPEFHTVWKIDEDGYIYYNQYYLSVGDDGKINVVTEKPTEDAGTFEIYNNQIRRMNHKEQYFGWNEVVKTKTDGEGNVIEDTYTDEDGNVWTRVTRYAVITTSENNRATYNEQTPAGGGSHGIYTVRIYDKTGTSVLKEKVVDGSSETITIDPVEDGFNNDAIKIGVVGTALIKGNVIMQALDPYLNRLDIVCQEVAENGTANGGRLTQQFSATDFSVRGKEFTFYVPSNFRKSCKFTFENLYTNYGDNDYYEANNNPENHARYFFVGSEYGNYDDNVYDRYKDHSDADYTTKIDCEQPGNRTFKFNNAEEAAATNNSYFEEYAFTPAKYSAQGGSFNDLIFTQSEMGNDSPAKTVYLYTCDETKYNIAPTTATQHVYYAYYELKMKMRKATYNPDITFHKIYEETFYSADNSNIKRDAQYGVELHTTPKATDDTGTHDGYLTVADIVSGIEEAIENGGDNVPDSKDQILYIDASSLMSVADLQTPSTSRKPKQQVDEDGKPVVDEDGNPVYERDENGEIVYEDVTTYTSTMSQLKDGFGQNVLVYLPVGVKSSLDNFASWNNGTEKFEAANNIIVADRYPFYAPFDIQVGAAKMAKYERTLTNQALYGDDDQHLTIVLPFEINVNASGVHTNNDGEGSPFMLSTMNRSNALSKNDGSQIDFYANGYFNKITEKSEPNKPYVVTMQGGTESSFKVHVNGSLVKATPSTPSITGILTGESATGVYTYKENNVEKMAHYSFTHEGTYTGLEIGDEKNGGAAKATTTVFYFANNFFLDSKTLAGGKSLKMLPFRSYYDYTVSGATAKVSRFRIVLGENPNMGGTNGITDVQRDADLAVIPGSRCITLMARADKDVTIHAVNGQTIDKCSLNAGETRVVNVPAGVYVINGVKMVVK